MTQEILDKANSIEQSRIAVDKLLFDILKEHHIQIGTEDGKTVRLDEMDWTIRDQIIAMLISNLQEIRKQLIDEFNKL
jgi:hypothetical protein